jgi:hypothetical protein
LWALLDDDGVVDVLLKGEEKGLASAVGTFGGGIIFDVGVPDAFVEGGCYAAFGADYEDHCALLVYFRFVKASRPLDRLA